MGYTTAVGTMVFDEMVTINEVLDGQMDVINTLLVRVEQDIERGHEWSRDHTEVVRGIEVDVRRLLASTTFMRGSMDWMRTEMDTLLSLNTRITEVITELRVAVCHGWDNLIVIDDNEQEEGEVVEVGLASPARTLVEGDHTLVEIVEETLDWEIINDWKSSPEV